MIKALAFVGMILPGATWAGSAWDMFEARCLDAYEHLTEPVVDGLVAQPTDETDKNMRTYGPTEDGYVMVLDAAPVDGERSCSVHKPGQAAFEPSFDAWVDANRASGRYLPELGRYVSNEWIEPQLQVTSEIQAEGLRYQVTETDLES